MRRARRTPAERREQTRLRVAAFRQREDAGLAIAPVPYHGGIVSWLVSHDWLPAKEAHTAAEIGKAVFAALDDMVGRH